MPFESQTNRSSPDHLKAKPFETRTQKVSERWPFENWTVRLSDGSVLFFYDTFMYKVVLLGDHLKTGLVRYSNPHCIQMFTVFFHVAALSDILQSPSEYQTNQVFKWLICVLESNGPVFKRHLNTGQTCPVYKWSISLAYILWSVWLKIRWVILPFENRTQIVSGKWPF